MISHTAHFFLHQWSRSMFKKLVPVVCLLAFAAGPVFAADTTTPSDSSASAPAKSTTHKKHSHKSKKSKSTAADSSAPK
jgi:hypothetical protein